MLYPTVSSWLDERKEAQLLAEMEAEFVNDYDESAASKAQDHFLQLGDIFADEPGDTAPEEEPEKDENTPIATLEIAKINLKLPVLEGATKENMRHATAHMSETSAFGEIGNAAIAGHRMRKKGRIFNRLNEVTVGDEIVIKQHGEELHYKVFSTKRVTPENVSVLNRNDKDKLLTLITCDPVVNPTHRIIVHAKME